MKLTTSLLFVLFFVGCQPKEEKKLDTDFEGAITYRLIDWDPKKMDSANAAIVRSYMPIDTMIIYFDEGSFVAFMDSSEVVDFDYFNVHENKDYSKLKGIDSVYVEAGEKKRSWETSLLDVLNEYNTDTILGHVCNRLTMKYKDQTKTYLYSSDFPTNPEWYKNTKSNNYDVLYKEMKSYYLSLRVDHKDYAFTLRAIRINPGKVPANIFPNVQDMPRMTSSD